MHLFDQEIGSDEQVVVTREGYYRAVVADAFDHAFGPDRAERGDSVDKTKFSDILKLQAGLLTVPVRDAGLGVIAKKVSDCLSASVSPHSRHNGASLPSSGCRCWLVHQCLFGNRCWASQHWHPNSRLLATEWKRPEFLVTTLATETRCGLLFRCVLAGWLSVRWDLSLPAPSGLPPPFPLNPEALCRVYPEPFFEFVMKLLADVYQVLTLVSVNSMRISSPKILW